MSDSMDDDDEDDGAHGLEIEAKWVTVQSLWSSTSSNMTAGTWGSRIGGTANTVGGIGASVAKNAAFGGIAGKVGLGAAAGALTAGTGGLAVVVGAGVMQLGSMALSAKSAMSTWEHLKALSAMSGTFQCTALGPAPDGAKDHRAIFNNIIPYIIRKKTAKLVKKGVGTVGLGAATGLFGVGKYLYKKARGTQGKRRTFYAFVVARHMITHDCKLCEALVTELTSREEYLRLRTMNSEDASGWLARKMKST